MKKILIVSLMLVSTLSFAHKKTREDKKQMYNIIQFQVERGKINIQTAQKMWREYIKCCEGEKEVN